MGGGGGGGGIHNKQKNLLKFMLSQSLFLSLHKEASISGTA